MTCVSGVASRSLAQSRARRLRTARELCTQIQKSFAGDESAPLQNLQAAEKHLLAVERWLLGRAPIEAPAKESLAAKLELPHGLASHDVEQSFHGAFGPLAEGEVLVQEVACSAKSYTFFHPGQLYITNTRLAFHSKVLGVKATFEVPWQDVVRVRMVDTQADTPSSTALPVRIALSKAAVFDEIALESLELRMFDHMGIVVLHRCTEVLTESRAFEEMVQAPVNPRLQRGATLQKATEKLERRNKVWELQRRTTVFCSFQPVEGCRWAMPGSFEQHALLPKDLTPEEVSEAPSPPIPQIRFLGRSRKCEWMVDVDPEATDGDGWQYGGFFFNSNAETWQPECSTLSHVRLRRWKPCFPAEEEGAVEDDAGHVTTLMEAERLDTKEIFEADIGEVPLELLASTLLQDDWMTDGLMAARFRDLGARDMEVGPWASGTGAATRVRGKLRSLGMRIPPPPAPMCPSETRVTSTYHVVSEAGHVILESSTLSLDVPYGTYFHVVICDTFSVHGDTGRTQMTRNFALQWEKSTWMQSMIETAVPEQLLKDAQRLADVTQKWAAQELGR
mmetsp:Transcript_98206/g.306379  ORF Transcript_98206/g.306379 Transcript_98206/m.306379 type:complete len:563 (-) Transcript_98206:110-1798(-)